MDRGVTGVSDPQRRGVSREVLALAVPALGALVAEPLFLLADSAIVGRLGTIPLAGLGVAGPILTAAVTVFVFLAYGTTASVARRLGAGDLPGALAQGVDGMWLALAIGAGTFALAYPAAPTLVAAFNPTPDVAEQAVTYLRASLPGMPAMLLVLAATGVLRGLQDTRTPLWVASVGAVVNAGLSADAGARHGPLRPAGDRRFGPGHRHHPAGHGGGRRRGGGAGGAPARRRSAPGPGGHPVRRADRGPAAGAHPGAAGGDPVDHLDGRRARGTSPWPPTRS